MIIISELRMDMYSYVLFSAARYVLPTFEFYYFAYDLIFNSDIVLKFSV